MWYIIGTEIKHGDKKKKKKDKKEEDKNGKNVKS